MNRPASLPPIHRMYWTPFHILTTLGETKAGAARAAGVSLAELERWRRAKVGEGIQAHHARRMRLVAARRLLRLHVQVLDLVAQCGKGDAELRQMAHDFLDEHMERWTNELLGVPLAGLAEWLAEHEPEGDA